MKRWTLILTIVIVYAACSKTTAGTEDSNPLSISAELVSVGEVEPDIVRVKGKAGAVSPGGGEIAISNVNQGGESIVVEVEPDGSFRAELPGSPNDDYKLVASNEHDSSPPRIITSATSVSDTGTAVNSSLDAGESMLRTDGGSSSVNGGLSAVCRLAFDPGLCEAAIRVFWHNPNTGRCEEAIYGGCEGNDNRFKTLEECEDVCVDLDSLTCQTDADCGWTEIPYDILMPSDCICLYGCPHIPLNTEAISRRQAQHNAMCDPEYDGSGEHCGIDDCILPPPAECVEGQCTGDLYGAI